MSTRLESMHCPDCGSLLSSEAWGENLCVVCLLRLAAPTLDSDTAITRAVGATAIAAQATAATSGELSLVSGAAAEAFEFSAGDVLADRYRVLKRLGRGGMGEVWRAYDLKLRVDVALQTLNASLAGEQGLELMRGEVRTAREVISPNVCRIFDLIEVDGHELVSMEFVDGHTLVRVLDERGPLDLQEAADIGSQLLAGLESIHSVGLVHRDIKPENVMLTRAKRVVIMDFGLTARMGEGLLAGTPVYMPPEQKRGEGTDARADVYSAGILLAELLAVGGDSADVIRHSIWYAVRETPPSLPEIPWRRILLKAVAADREDHYESAAAMARTLEKVAIRVEDAENKTPYPGLAAYAFDGAEFFFGREAEVEALWKKLQHAHLLGLIGASGAGKSSFVQARLLPALPKSWSCLQLKPGRSPFTRLATALAPALQFDRVALTHLNSPDDPGAMLAAVSAWRRQHPETLLIIDQFEELFTQNSAASQHAFVEFLTRVALEADVHVLLSMRDDFLMRCNDFPKLAPIFSELTPLKPLSGSGLRRALVHPALKCGYRFENDGIVEEMLAEVTRERAALPLIAFTTARMWEERERDTGLLTQEVYDRLGGVAGALAQRAEETLEAIGSERIPIVREFFRNLVTAQGTRATAEVDELRSLFHQDHQNDDAAEVLQALIDGRLLTSYEVQAEEGAAPVRRVEVVHESLLSAWPRLVRWQSQDADSRQLRDELRHAAKLWDSRRRPDDLLWSGTAYREFRLWRERYPGRLTAVEEAFVAAMTTAGERARRRRQRIVTATIAALLVVVAGVTLLWRQSEAARLRAEAQTMVAQATQSTLDSYPTGALAWAIRSLEVSDTRQGRLLALQALWRGPPAWKVNDYPGSSAQFSPDGSELLQGTRRSQAGSLLQVIGADGSSAAISGGHDAERIGALYQAADPDVIISMRGLPNYGIEYGLWSASRRRNTSLVALEGFWGQEHARWNTALGGVVQLDYEGSVTLGTFDGRPPRVLGTVPGDGPRTLAADATWFAQVVDGRIETVALDADGAGRAREIGRHTAATAIAVNGPTGRVATRDDTGEIRVWNTTDRGAGGDGAVPVVVAGPVGPGAMLQFGSNGEFLTFRRRAPDRAEPGWELWTVPLSEGTPRPRRLSDHPLQGPAILDASRKQVGALVSPGAMVWHRLASPDGSQGLPLQAGAARSMMLPSFHPSGDWVTGQHNWLTAWSLARPYPMVIPVYGRQATFGPDGSELVAAAREEEGISRTFSWPLDGPAPGPRSRISGHSAWMELSPDGKTLAFGGGRNSDLTVPLLVQRDGSAERRLIDGFADQTVAIDFSPDGRLVAAVGGQFDAAEQVVKVWDVASGELVAVHDPAAQALARVETASQDPDESGPAENDTDVAVWYLDVTFAGNRKILWTGASSLFLWDLDLDEHRLLAPRGLEFASVDRAGSLVVASEGRTGRLFRIDVVTGVTTEITAYGPDVYIFTLSHDGKLLATADRGGTVRVGSPTNDEPHLLFSHSGLPTAIAIDPLGRWLATTSDAEIRLWPMPDLSQPPLHTLPYDELLTRLRSLTNVRLIEDPDTPEGWSLTFEPFPGWESTPMW